MAKEFSNFKNKIFISIYGRNLNRILDESLTVQKIRC
jgi:hypothetical protein